MPPTNLSLARQVDAACDHFEAAWRAGKAPRIEDHVGRATGADRTDLLRALIAVEVELRRAAGEAVAAGSYGERFPDDPDAVASALAEAGRPRVAGDTSVSRESVRTGKFDARTGTAAPLQADFPVPKHIGRFKVMGLLGAGAFGRVYRATDPQLGREVAIKVPLPSAIATPADRERFLREARAAAGLHHPNICPVHEVGEENGHPYIVMGFVPGQSLAAVLKTRKEPLAPKQAALIARKLALALDAAHKKGVVHRDLKPANVMFDKERRDVVVTDFGLARAPRFGDDQTTRDGVLMGTPAYMSPEQARGDTKAVGPASDQYALGVMLYEMLTGRRPFTGTVTEVLGKILHVEPESPAALRPDLDPALAAVCVKAMAKDPAARYASMRQLADALVGFASDAPTRPVGAPATTSAETAKGATETQRIADVFAFTEQAVEKAIRKHRTPTWMKVGIGLLILIGLVVPGIVFFARTPTAKVTIQIDVDIHDKTLAFFLDGKTIEGEALTREIELKVGKHVLEVKKNGQVIRRYEFNVSKDAGPRIELKEDPPKDKGPPPSDDGFVSLFNGKDLTGWRKTGVPSGWSVENGEIVAEAVEQDRNVGWLMTEKDYADFTLKLDFMTATGTDSGVAFRCDASETSGAAQAEIQIVDEQDADLVRVLDEQPHRRTGALAGHSSLRTLTKLDRGVWHSLTIELRGRQLKATVDGAVTVDTNLNEHVEKGKKLNRRGIWQPSGPIGLQKFRGSVRFRNIRIKELAPAAEEGFVPLFNGRDLTGWRVAAGDPGNWLIKDGELVGLRLGTGVGWLLTDKDYGSYVLRFEVRMRQQANTSSGLMFRLAATEYESFVIKLMDDTNRSKWSIDNQEVTGSFWVRDKQSNLVMLPPKQRAKLNPGGEWNQAELTLDGKFATLTINGETIQSIDLAEYAEQVGENRPLSRDRGRIGFQAHTSIVRFRNVRIKELAAPVAAADPDRAAAEWALGIGGNVRVAAQDRLPATLNDANQLPALTRADQLPRTPFRLVGVGLIEKIDESNEAGLAKLNGLKHLQVLNLMNARVTDRGLATLTDLPALRGLNLHATRVSNAGLKSVARFRSLESLWLHYLAISDDGLAELTGLTQMKTLFLQGTKVTDRGLKHVGKLSRLEGLGTSQTLVTDAGLAELAGLTNLMALNVSGPEFTGAGLKHLHRLPKLGTLELDGTGLTDDGLAALPGLTRLTWLQLTPVPNVTDAGLKQLAGMTHLTVLRLNSNRITDDGLAHLAKLEQLSELRLAGAKITDDGLKHLGSLWRLSHLDLNGTAITGTGLKHLTKSGQLRGLAFQDCPVTDSGLVAVAGLKALEELNLTRTKVTDEGLASVAKLAALKSVDLTGCSVSNDSLVRLKKALPGCAIEPAPK